MTRYVFTFFQVSQKQEDDEDDDAGSDISSGSGSSVDMNSGYTANEIAQMRSDKEAEIKDLQFSIKMAEAEYKICLLYTSPSPRDRQKSRMPSSA